MLKIKTTSHNGSIVMFYCFFICYIENPNVMPNANKTVNEREEFVCIYKLKLGTHNILYRAETDGILANDDGDKGKALSDDKSEEDQVRELRNRTFVELKSSDIDINHPRFK